MRLEIKGLKKRFGDLVVFDGLDLTIEPGERCVIMGRSGTGKSVLLKHLVGLLQPDEGEILIDGQNIVGLKETELYPIRMRFGMIFQNGGMLHSLNVGENVALPLIEVRGTDPEKTMRKVAQKLEMVGLEGREEQSVTTLSGGQQKRAAIARALVQEADCMLFDEPTSGLDPPISKTVDDIIVDVNERTDATMIVVSHDLVNAFRVGDRLHLLDGGKIVFSGTAQEFRECEHEAVKEYMARGVGV